MAPAQRRPRISTALNRPERIGRLKDAMLQLAEALSYIHGHGLVHRDLKPSNVMVDEDRLVRLMDFGLAKFLADDGAVTADGRLVGTFRYMAPEQILGEGLDARADLYSLGVILYELLTGRTPFDARTPHELWQKVLETEPPPLVSLNPGADAALARIAHRLIRKEPDERLPDRRRGLRGAGGVSAGKQDASRFPRTPPGQRLDLWSSASRWRLSRAKVKELFEAGRGAASAADASAKGDQTVAGARAGGRAAPVERSDGRSPSRTLPLAVLHVDARAGLRGQARRAARATRCSPGSGARWRTRWSPATPSAPRPRRTRARAGWSTGWTSRPRGCCSPRAPATAWERGAPGLRRTARWTSATWRW